MPPLEVVDAPPERVETIDAVWRAVAALNPDLKMALLLRDVVGLSYTEIADSLEITLATVKWRIFKAREEVQLALAREGVSVEFSGERAAVLRRLIPAAGRAAPAGRARGSRLRLLDRVLDAAVDGRLRLEVEEEPRGARVPVARLPDRARVEEPALRGRSTCDPSSPSASVRSSAPKRSATWLCPTSTSGFSVASSERNATSGASTYSQTGSRGLAWKSSARSSAASGESDSR